MKIFFLTGFVILLFMPAGFAADDKQPYAAGHFAVELDGKKTAGLVQSVDGGAIKAEKVSERSFFKPVQGIKSEIEITDYKEGGVSGDNPKLPGQSNSLRENSIAVQDAFGRPIFEPDPEAAFNPKEIPLDKSVPWQKHKNSESDAPTLEFTASEPKALSAELQLDTYEDQPPPKQRVVWGSEGGFSERGLNDVGEKYTMFMEEGAPVRATTELNRKEAGEGHSKNKNEASEERKKESKGDDEDHA